VVGIIEIFGGIRRDLDRFAVGCPFPNGNMIFRLHCLRKVG
jgi:hypothetical protein